jgi:hypothetical protein
MSKKYLTNLSTIIRRIGGSPVQGGQLSSCQGKPMDRILFYFYFLIIMVVCITSNSCLTVSGTPDPVRFASNPDMKIDSFRSPPSNYCSTGQKFIITCS